jgi:hypothetical protein
MVSSFCERPGGLAIASPIPTITRTLFMLLKDE